MHYARYPTLGPSSLLFTSPPMETWQQTVSGRICAVPRCTSKKNKKQRKSLTHKEVPLYDCNTSPCWLLSLRSHVHCYNPSPADKRNITIAVNTRPALSRVFKNYMFILSISVLLLVFLLLIKVNKFVFNANRNNMILFIQLTGFIVSIL